MAIYFHLLLQFIIILQIIFFHVTCIGYVTRIYNSSSSQPQCIEIERQALLHFKGNITDISGQLSSWVGEDCCKWTGVGCNSHTGHVVKLDLGNVLQKDQTLCANSQLSGKLSPSLLHLNHLNFLNLSCNNFSGTIPIFIGSLQKLKYLDLYYTNLEQMVPPQLGNLSNLHYLDLSYNFLWVSDLNWFSGLDSFEYLNLEFVNHSKASASLPRATSFLPSLSELHLAHSSLDNRISLLSLSIENFTSLSVIDLSENMLISEIPPWLINITTLVELYLSSCNITAPVSRLPWHNLHKLEVLDLDGNSVTDNIGTFIDLLSERSNSTLRKLNLALNHFSGQLGESLGRLSSLTSLALEENSISGEIPSSIGRLSFLEELFLLGNFMNGSIPESIGELSSLSMLYLYGNWTGKLSEVHFMKLRKLKSLEISSSNGALVFEMAPDWIPPFSLEDLYIYDCRLGPAFPPWIQTQTEVNKITMSNAQISDTIPYWFWNLSTRQVHYLDLSGNEIGGVLPYSLEFQCPNDDFYGIRVYLSNNNLHGPIPLWSNLSSLILSNNSFSGPIPRKIGTNMLYLEDIDLSSNFLNGTIPKSISTIENLYILDLSNNKLSGKMFDKLNCLRGLKYLDLSKNGLLGKIPSSICSSPSLNWLDLSDNGFNGALPLSLQNCTRLEGLNLGGNRLSGNIPPWMRNSFEDLQLLKLQKNKLTGGIPQDLCHLPSLHAIDLSHNNLTGTIPACFGNLSGLLMVPAKCHDYIGHTKAMDFSVKGRLMEYIESLCLLYIIDLSNNDLIGEIPEEISNASFLGFLNLSGNQLTGRIPQNIGGLRQLETLDLSHNRLSGLIPLSLASLTFLDDLDLSFNNLSGQIPRANQFSTFNNSIYEGNPGLCGDPLPNICYTPRDSGDSNKGKFKKGKGRNKYINNKFWYGVSVGLGFIMGFWGLVGSLVIKRSWRTTYFKFFHRVKDGVFVFIAVKITCFKQII